mmetsp:Transcript_9532/g.39942  ORF Transcript_9532/g.39942 Transcript_9532/m.39942 type:complete len:286 (+) Transcript_9532:530-1387(+)
MFPSHWSCDKSSSSGFLPETTANRSRRPRCVVGTYMPSVAFERPMDGRLPMLPSQLSSARSSASLARPSGCNTVNRSRRPSSRRHPLSRVVRLKSCLRPRFGLYDLFPSHSSGWFRSAGFRPTVRAPAAPTCCMVSNRCSRPARLFTPTGGARRPPVYCPAPGTGLRAVLASEMRSFCRSALCRSGSCHSLRSVCRPGVASGFSARQRSWSAIVLGAPNRPRYGSNSCIGPTRGLGSGVGPGSWRLWRSYRCKSSFQEMPEGSMADARLASGAGGEVTRVPRECG